MRGARGQPSCLNSVQKGDVPLPSRAADLSASGRRSPAPSPYQGCVVPGQLLHRGGACGQIHDVRQLSEHGWVGELKGSQGKP